MSNLARLDRRDIYLGCRGEDDNAKPQSRYKIISSFYGYLREI